jgi:hypothetical protein
MRAAGLVGYVYCVSDDRYFLFTRLFPYALERSRGNLMITGWEVISFEHVG